VASTKQAAERARTAAATTETAARDTTQAAAREKVSLEARVSELERDLGTTTADLTTAGCQFFQVSNQLQEISEAATRLRESNAKLSEDLEGELCGCFPSSYPSVPISCRVLICWSSSQGLACIAPDDREVRGAEAGAELRPPQSHREGWCNRAPVGATSE
jgi:hypothetical protein